MRITIIGLRRRSERRLILITDFLFTFFIIVGEKMNSKILEKNSGYEINIGESVPYRYIRNENPQNNSLMNIITNNNSLLKDNKFLLEKIVNKLLMDDDLIKENKKLIKENEVLRENNKNYKEKIFYLKSEDKNDAWNRMIALKEQNKALKNSYEDIKKKYRKLKIKKKKNPRVQLDKNMKRLVYEKHNFQCSICGEKDLNELTVDHINPIALCGTNDINNLQILCKKCNSLKGASTLTNEEIKMIVDNRK